MMLEKTISQDCTPEMRKTDSLEFDFCRTSKPGQVLTTTEQSRWKSKSAANVTCANVSAITNSNMRSLRRLAFLKRSGLFDGNVEGVTFERAWSLNDLREAYRLVHDVYAKSGYICSESSRVRVRIFEMTP